ncbi:MAG: sodium/sugar symporter [Deltaproteobacteria bacterium]|nr:sodium/sugar symporter [Deltaproteobacteria bacterium]
MNLHPIDITIIVVYCVALLGIAYWVSREKDGKEKDAKSYFLADRSLPWWAIGASLIAANISAEQIIGMSGSGYAIGLAISAYEWMAALTLIIVGKYFIPIFLKKEIYTMPEFLEKRYDHRVRMILGIFWLVVYVFVNLTSVMYLGGLAINTITGLDMQTGITALAVFALLYSIYGGLKAVAMTDIIQVVMLIFGGVIITYLALNNISGGAGSMQGFTMLLDQAADKFDLILDKEHSFYSDLPGISVLIGGMWIMNLSYWGFNQYITQRALAAKSLDEAQKGIVFAGYLKMLMPLIIVIPGIAAYVMDPTLSPADKAYPTLMTLVPVGLKGLVFAALIAAIVSSLSSMANSISTIFTMDLYKRFWVKDASESKLVKVGRIVVAVSFLIAVLVAKPLLGNLDQAFQFIQEFTGFFTPGIVAIFMLAVFYKQTTAAGALAAALGSLALSIGMKLGMPAFPFMDRMGVVFIFSIVVAVAVSYMQGNKVHEKAIDLNDVSFKTSKNFNLATLGIVLMLIGLYAAWW